MIDNNSTWRKDFLGIENNKSKSLKNLSVIKHIIKRDGQLEFYNKDKIYDAIKKAAKEVNKDSNDKLITRLTNRVEDKLKFFMSDRHSNSAPAIE